MGRIHFTLEQVVKILDIKNPQVTPWLADFLVNNVSVIQGAVISKQMNFNYHQTRTLNFKLPLSRFPFSYHPFSLLPCYPLAHLLSPFTIPPYHLVTLSPFHFPVSHLQFPVSVLLFPSPPSHIYGI
ncbi:hypothetical protein SAMN03080601_02358 [Alkalitalea saponilacus]|uniref:Uncharacterized protein n=1 Tax=Alkalitalea saponilacus TaxID=889453 RepID=A0A1T5HKF8_9BACT|nr:hypothetical protein SAMN03080601_02358 [Alkalitalea saponilacus]